jgi:hypothetical protein
MCGVRVIGIDVFNSCEFQAVERRPVAGNRAMEQVSSIINGTS